MAGESQRNNPYTYPAVIGGHLWAWTRAVELQAGRVTSAESRVDRQIDAYLFVVAVRQVARAAKAIIKATGDASATKAYDSFLASVPHATDLRDVLMHFDRYEKGTGHLQGNGALQPLTVGTEVGDDRVWLTINHLKVEIGSAAREASQLADAVLEAQHRFRGRTSRRSDA